MNYVIEIFKRKKVLCLECVDGRLTHGRIQKQKIPIFKIISDAKDI